MATLIVSPHFDDAVLSCWHLLDGVTEVGIVNVFGGAPPADTAGWWDLAGGMRSSSRVVERRRSEDQAGLALAGREAITLDFLDCQYRDGPQPIEPLIQGLRDLLAGVTSLWAPAALASPPDDPGRIPAARRPHPDHVLVRSAALTLHAEGCPVMLYADLPHASARGLPGWVTGHPDRTGAAVSACWLRCLADARVGEADAEIHRLSGRTLERKLEAVRRYASQLAPLEHGFGQAIDTPGLLNHEVVWRLR